LNLGAKKKKQKISKDPGRSRSDEAWLEKFDGDLATSDKKGRIL
jgi:hypothetical protein